MKRQTFCQLPGSMTITGRSSSLTNAFIAAIVPAIRPTVQEELEALSILEMDPADIRCAYCGDKCTEWDHLRPIVSDQAPTGYITEIANLVPSCGKCNQSKGKSEWRTWMASSAPLSPTTRGIPDLRSRMQRLEAYERWRKPTRLDFEGIAGTELWKRHMENWVNVQALLKASQTVAVEIREKIARHRQDSI